MNQITMEEINNMSEEELENWFDNLPTRKCQCGREYPDIPMYFSYKGLCVICNQK